VQVNSDEGEKKPEELLNPNRQGQ